MRFLAFLSAALPLATALPNAASVESEDLSLEARAVQDQQQCNVGGYDGGRYQPRQVIQKKNCDAYTCSTYCKQASWCKSFAIGQDSCRLYTACVLGNMKSTRYAPAYHFYDRACPCRFAPQKTTTTTSKCTTTKKTTTTTKCTTPVRTTTKTTTPSTTKTTTASTTPSTTRSTTRATLPSTTTSTPSTTPSTTSSTTTSRTTTTQSAYCTGAFRLQHNESQLSYYPYVYRSDGTEYTFSTSDTDCASFIIDNSVSGHPNLLKNVDVETYAYHTGPGTGVMDDTLDNILDNNDRKLIGGCTIYTSSGVISCDVPSGSFGFDGAGRVAVNNENGNPPNTGRPPDNLVNYTPASIVLTALCNLPYKPPCYRGDYCFDADHQFTQVCGKRVVRPASGRISTETTIDACRSGCFSDGNCDLYDFGFDGKVCTFYAQDGMDFLTEADDFHTYGYFSGGCRQKR